MSNINKAYSTLSDSRLAALSADGDNFAFNELVLRYISLINHIAQKYSAAGYEQKDFVQEGLVGLLYACKTFDENAGSAFKNYMAVIVERRFISIIRKSNSQRSVPLSSILTLDDLEEEPQDFSQNPEDIIMCRDCLEAVLANLKNLLSDTEYKVLMLFCGGQSYKQIAQTLSISPKAADNALSRARKKLRNH